MNFLFLISSYKNPDSEFLTDPLIFRDFRAKTWVVYQVRCIFPTSCHLHLWRRVISLRCEFVRTGFTLPSTREHAMPKSITLSHVTTMMMIFTTSSRYHIANVTVTVVVNALTAIRTAAIARVMSHIVSKVSHHNPIFSKFSTSLPLLRN